MSNFFHTVNTISPGMGFDHFGITHILWLIFSVFSIFRLSVSYKKAGREKKEKIKHAVAIALIFEEMAKTILLLILGRYTADHLPLHLCSINIFIIAIHAYHPSKILGSFLYNVCIPASISALLFPGWTSLPFLNFMHIHSFTTHILLAAYPIMLVSAKEIGPDISGAVSSLFFLLALAGIIYMVNIALGTNFMFLMYPGGDNPLSFFARVFGNHLVGFIILVPFVLVFMNFPLFILKNSKNGN